MITRRFGPNAACLALVALLGACLPSPSGGRGGDDGSADGDGDGEGDGDGALDGDEIDDIPCYESGADTCQDVTWSDLENAIDVLYELKEGYQGFTKEEAKERAKELYDQGVPQQAGLRVLGAQSLEAGKYRAFVVVTGEDGLPQKDLGVADFAVQAGADMPLTVTRVRPLRDVDSSDLHVELSVVVDDSGSVQDCDARFVAQGLEHVFSSLPPVYAAQLLKFDATIMEAAARTEDRSVLADAAANMCTERGATALWDAMDRGLSDLPADADLRAQVVFTDGLDNASQLGRKAVAEHAEAAEVPIFTVALGFADVLSLSRLYEKADGGLVYVPSGEKILRGFEQLTDFVVYTYVVELEGPEGATSLSVTAHEKTDSAKVHPRP